MYNKLFTKVLDSSIWLESHPTRIVWLTMLAVMDEDGMCQFASVSNLARRAIVTLEEAKSAIDVLEAPDADSSDPDNEGRRIERVPGGWIVLNCQKYRDQATREQIREKTRERVRRFRIGKVTQKTLQESEGNDAVTPTPPKTEFGNAPVTTAVAVAVEKKVSLPERPDSSPTEEELTGTGISIQEFNSFMLVRRKMKKTFIDQSARERWIRKWKGNFQQGKDTSAMIQLMIENHWQGPVEEKWTKRKMEGPSYKVISWDEAWKGEVPQA